VPGAAVATGGIFLLSFFYVALLAAVLVPGDAIAWIEAFLDSVNLGAVFACGGSYVSPGPMLSGMGSHGRSRLLR
jgi:hypothetical protein